MALAYIGGFMMYMLVFIFGAQVMRGVIEEKTSRVVEVIISSVKADPADDGKNNRNCTCRTYSIHDMGSAYHWPLSLSLSHL